MVKGVGNDIVEVERIKKALGRHGQRFLDKILTSQEQEYCKKYKNPILHYAGRFSAKEAVVKAFGTGFGKDISFCDIEILNNEFGQPQVFFSEKVIAAFKNPNVIISISHSKKHATAVAIWREGQG